MQKITTFLTYDGRAEDAVAFYTSIFPDSRIVSERRYGSAGPGPEGSLMTATFELAGQTFMALNGGSSFGFAQGISLFVDCEDQAEVDRLWDALTADGGEPGPCGWLKDRFGVSWQIVPDALGEMMSKGTPEQIMRITEAFLPMKKFDIAALRKAYEGKA